MSDADDAEEPDEERPVRDVVRVAGPESSDNPDNPEGDGGPPVDREGVMDPDELDIRGRDGVDETDDGRYVISTGRENLGDRRDDGRGDRLRGGRDDSEDRDEVADDAADDAADDDDAAGDPLDAVAAELDALSTSHGFALAVAGGGETDTLRVASGEPTDTLATALRWYARRVNPGAPAEETIRDLLAASDLDVG